MHPTTPPRPIPSSAATQLEALLPDLLRVARYLTRDRDTADDLVQDIVLRLWRRMADTEKDPIDDLRHYAFSALRNRIRDRGARQLIEAQVFSKQPLVEDTAAAKLGPEAPARIACKDTLKALEDMPSDQAELVRLYGVQGLSYLEIAERLGIAEGTVTSRLSRARAELRRKMGLPAGAPVTFLLE